MTAQKAALLLQGAQGQLCGALTLARHHPVAGQIAVHILHLGQRQQQDAVMTDAGDGAQRGGHLSRITTARGFRCLHPDRCGLTPRQQQQAIQSALQPARIQRLEQVIQRMLLEGAQRVLIERGDKYDMGQRLRIQHAHQLQTADARHLDIQKQHIGFQPMDGGQRLQGMGALAQHLDATGGLQQQTQLLAGQGFIIDDERS